MRPCKQLSCCLNVSFLHTKQQRGRSSIDFQRSQMTKQIKKALICHQWQWYIASMSEINVNSEV